MVKCVYSCLEVSEWDVDVIGGFSDRGVINVFDKNIFCGVVGVKILIEGV